MKYMYRISYVSSLIMLYYKYKHLAIKYSSETMCMPIVAIGYYFACTYYTTEYCMYVLYIVYINLNAHFSYDIR